MALDDILGALPRPGGAPPRDRVSSAVAGAALDPGRVQALSRAAAEAARRSVDWEAFLERAALPGGVSVARHYAGALRGLLEALEAAQAFAASRAPLLAACEGVPVTGGRSRALFRLLRALSEAEGSSAALEALARRARAPGALPFREAEDRARAASAAAARNLRVLARDRAAFEMAARSRAPGAMGAPW